MRRRGLASSKYLFSHQKYLLERVSLAWPVAFTYFHISAYKSNAKAVVPACYLINLELFSLFLLQKLQYRDNSSVIPVTHTCFGFFSRKIIMRGQLYQQLVRLVIHTYYCFINHKNCNVKKAALLGWLRVLVFTFPLIKIVRPE